MSQSLILFTTVALKGVLERIAPEFTQATGFTFVPSWGPGGTIAKWMREGRSADVVVVTPDLFDELVQEGHCAAGTGRDIASSVVGVAVKAGAPRPDISTAAAFKQALLAAKSVAYTDPSTGAATAVLHVAATSSSRTDEGRRARLGQPRLQSEMLVRCKAYVRQLVIDLRSSPFSAIVFPSLATRHQSVGSARKFQVQAARILCMRVYAIYLVIDRQSLRNLVQSLHLRVGRNRV